MLAPKSLPSVVSSPEARLPFQVASPNATPGAGIVLRAPESGEYPADRPDVVSLARPYVTDEANVAGAHEGPECTPPSISVPEFQELYGAVTRDGLHVLPALARTMHDCPVYVRDYLSVHPYSAATDGNMSTADAINLWSYERMLAEHTPGLAVPRGVAADMGRSALHFDGSPTDVDRPAMVYVTDGRTDERMQVVAAAMAWRASPTSSLTVVSHRSLRTASLQAAHESGRVPANLHAEIQARDVDQLAAEVQSRGITHCTLVGVGSGAAVAAEFAAQVARAETTDHSPYSGVHVGHIALLGIPGGRQRSPERIEQALLMSGLAGLQERQVVSAYRRSAQGDRHSAFRTLIGGLRTGLLRSPSQRYISQSLHMPSDPHRIAMDLAVATKYGGSTVSLGAADTRTARSIIGTVRAAYTAEDPALKTAIVERLATGGLIHGGREESVTVNPLVIAALIRSMLP